MIARTALVAGLLLGAGACSPQPELEPTPQAVTVPGEGEGVVETAAGVRMEARVDAWEGTPDDLDRAVTPILIEIENGSDHPLLLRYNKFQLTGGGEKFAVMPPFALEGEVTDAYTVSRYYFPMAGFAVAPYLAPFYPGLDPYVGDFVYDPLYYDPYVTALREIELPTADMIRRALPEGVVQPGGRAMGFLYFQNIGDDPERVTLSADLTDATNDQQFGTINIPFAVDD